MSMNELNSTARDLMSVRAMIEELQAEAEALTDKLKAAMVERGTEALQGDGWKATWKNVNSQRFDSKSFKADHQRKPRLYRVALELSKFDDPYKALDLLLALVESTQKEEEANHE